MRSRASLFDAVFLLLLALGKPLLSSAATNHDGYYSSDEDDHYSSDSNDHDDYASGYDDYYTKFPYEPISEVDSDAYIGRWFQAYGSASVIYTFELGGNCVTADYFATDKPRTIRVKNTVRPFGDFGGQGGFFGDILSFCGALVVNGFLSQSPNVDGQGYVELQPGPIPLGIGTPDINDVMYQSPGNYWIIDLGPIKDGQYRYSVVTNALQTQLYILVRDLEEFEAEYEKQVLRLVKSWGFTTPTNKPIKTNQENCGYE